MKNIHSLIHLLKNPPEKLFSENRIVHKDHISEQIIKDKYKEQLSQVKSIDRLKSMKLFTETDIPQNIETTLKIPEKAEGFTPQDLDKSMEQIVPVFTPGLMLEPIARDLLARDLKQSYQESQEEKPVDIQDKIKKEKLTHLRFRREGDKINILGLAAKDQEDAPPLVKRLIELASFNVKSSVREKFEKNKEAIEEIEGLKRKRIQELSTNEMLREGFFKRTKGFTDKHLGKMGDLYNIEYRPEENEESDVQKAYVFYGKIDAKGASFMRVDFSFNQETKEYGYDVFADIKNDGSALKLDKYSVSGGKTMKFPSEDIIAEIEDDILEGQFGEKEEEEEEEPAKPEASGEETKPLEPAPETEPATAAVELKVKKVEDREEDRKKVEIDEEESGIEDVDGEQLLVVKTQNHFYYYKGQKAKDAKPATWHYLRESKKRLKNEDVIKEKGTDERYLDSSARVTEDGSAYTGKGRKKSGIIGAVIDIVRKEEKEPEKEKPKRELGEGISNLELKKEPKDEEALKRTLTSARTNLQTLFDEVKERSTKPMEERELEPEFTTIEGIVGMLEEQAKELSETDPNLKKVSFTIHENTLNWANGKFEGGDKDKLTKQALGILGGVLSAEEYEAFVEKDKTIEASQHLQELADEAREKRHSEYGKKIRQTYVLTELKNQLKQMGEGRLYEEDFVENWNLSEGTAPITKILTDPSKPFKIDSSLVPKMSAAIISVGSNYQLDINDVFKSLKIDIGTLGLNKSEMDILKEFAKRTKDNPTQDFSESPEVSIADINSYLFDRNRLATTLDELYASGKKSHMDLADKIYNRIADPCLELLESLSKLRMARTREEYQPENMAEHLEILMNSAKPKDFELYDAYKLSEVSPYQNSNDLEIGLAGVARQQFISETSKFHRTRLDDGEILNVVFNLIDPETLAKEGYLEKNPSGQLRLSELPDELKNPDAELQKKITEVLEGKTSKYKKKLSDFEIKEKLNLIDKQRKLINQLVKLFGEVDERGWVKKVLHAIGGKSNMITLTEIDGSKTFIDRSKLSTELTEEAAKNFFLAHEGKCYQIDQVTGLPILDINQVQKRVNEFITYGYMQLSTEHREEGKYDKDLSKLMVTDIMTAGLNEDQVQAFQAGLLMKYNGEYMKQMSEYISKNPAEYKIMTELMKLGASPEMAREAYNKLMAAGGLLYNTKTGEVAGGGALGVTLKNGVFIAVDVSGGGDGATVGLTLGYKNKTSMIALRVSTGGVSLTAAKGVAKVRVGRSTDLNVWVGGHISIGWDVVLSGAAVAGAHFEVNIEDEIKYQIKEIEKSKEVDDKNIEDVLKAVEEFKKTKILDERIKALKKIPRYNKLFKPMKVNGIDVDLSKTPEIIAAIAEADYETLKRRGAEKADTWLVPFLPVTKFGVAGGYPPLTLYVALSPGVVVNRPILPEEAKFIPGLSGLTIDKALAKKIGEGEPASGEYLDPNANFADIYVTPEGKIGYLEEDGRAEAKLSLADVPSFNRNMAEAGLRVELAGGKRVIRVSETKKTDFMPNIEAELFVDDALEGEFAAVHTGDRIIMEGNIDDLVIARERYFFPTKTAVGGSTIRDYITIRKRAGIKGAKSTMATKDQAKGKLVKLPGDDWSDREGPTAMYAGTSKTVMNQEEFYSDENKSLREKLARAQSREEFVSEREYEAEWKNAGATPDVKTRTEFLEEFMDSEMQEGVKNSIDHLLSRKDGKFKKEVQEQLKPNKSTDLASLIQKYKKEIFGEGVEPSAGQLNYAIQYLKHRYFLDLTEVALRKAGFEKEDKEKLKKWMAAFSKAKTPEEKAELLSHLSEKQRAQLEKALGEVVKSAVKVAKANMELVVQGFKKDFNNAIIRLKNRGVKLDAKITGELVGEHIRKITIKSIEEAPTGNIMELIEHPLISLNLAAGFDSTDPSSLAGTTITYGTHKGRDKKGKAIPATTKTIGSYATANRTIRKPGLLKDTVTNYNLEGGTSEDQQIAQVLLEAASPLPESKEHEKFLNTEFAVKVANMRIYKFKPFALPKITVKTDKGPLTWTNKDYLALAEASKDSSTIGKHKEVIEKFHKICTQMRNDELAQKATVIKAKDVTLKITINPKIQSGAWSDCSNLSTVLLEKGLKVEMFKDGMPITAKQDSLFKLEVQKTKEHPVEIGFGVAFKFDGPSPDPDPDPDKDAALGEGANVTKGKGSTTVGTGGNENGPGVESNGVELGY